MEGVFAEKDWSVSKYYRKILTIENIVLYSAVHF